MQNSVRFIQSLTFYVAVSLLLSACGGGGGDLKPVSIAPATPPVSTGPTWTKDVFQDDSNFKNRCEAPRTGTNPATGSAYPDVAGSTLEENHWLRSWSNDTYLWYSEIGDVDPATVSDRLAYFDILKTNATTSSGNAKDNFHFSINTADYQQQVSTGSSSGYGMRYAIIQGSPPREIRVSLVETDSPAGRAPASLMRGAEILEIDGIDVISGSNVDGLNAGLFPDGDGEAHTFLVRDIGSTTSRSISLTSETVVSAAVRETKTISTASGNVGYILFNTFGIEDSEVQIIDAITQMDTDNIQDLVLDLRYNGGGFLDIAGQIGYMIAGQARTNSRVFDAISFNDKYPSINPVTGQTLSPTPFHSTSLGFSVPQGQALPTLDLDRIFILSTSRTCSASEAVINGLRGVDVEVILVGSTTCGKPYGFYATDNCGETYFTIQFQGENDKGFGEYSDGFSPMNASGTIGELVPGCQVSDDFLNQLGDQNEAMLETALSYRTNGVCPTSGSAASNKTVFASEQSTIDKLNDQRVGSLYNSDIMRKQLVIEMAKQQSRPNTKTQQGEK